VVVVVVLVETTAQTDKTEEKQRECFEVHVESSATAADSINKRQSTTQKEQQTSNVVFLPFFRFKSSTVISVRKQLNRRDTQQSKECAKNLLFNFNNSG